MRIIISLLFIFFIAGCATTPQVVPPSGKIEGLYHKVQRGETLWKISKIYDVEIEEITRFNRLKDASRLEAGQSIFIPYADKRPSGGAASFKGTHANFIWPVEGRVTSWYGSLNEGIKNKGIDIRADEGQSVVASRTGKVSFSDEKVKGFGKTVIIDHGDGYSTVYAYNSEILVKVGDYVKQGSPIARAGRSGRTDTACLHFEIRKQHRPENPFYYLP